MLLQLQLAAVEEIIPSQIVADSKEAATKMMTAWWRFRQVAWMMTVSRWASVPPLLPLRTQPVAAAAAGATGDDAATSIEMSMKTMLDSQ